jgi:hypothetical protein
MLPVGYHLPTLGICALFLGLTGCQDTTQPDLTDSRPTLAAAEAETSTVVEVFPDEFTAILFCTNEEVTWTGQVTLVIHTTYNRGVPPAPDSFQHLIQVNAVHYTGTGLSSGDTYRYNATFNYSLQSPDTDSPFPTTETLAVRERIIGPRGVIGFATFTFRILLSGSGEVVIEPVDVASEECW